MYYPELFYLTLKHTSRTVQLYVTMCVMGMCISIITMGFGIYLITTTEKPAQGGFINHVILQEQYTRANPVLTLTSPIEKTISSMLFAPLYTFSQDTDDVRIQPVLLESIPSFTDDTFTTARYVLKKSLTWNDGSEITTQDIQYSFDRIKEKGGNEAFHLTFQPLTLTIVDSHTFEIVSPFSDQHLLKKTNFTPISASYFSYQSNLGLQTDARSFAPRKVSGAYMLPQVIENPLESLTKRENPVRNSQNQYSLIQLQRNTQSTVAQQAYIDRYSFFFVDSIISNTSTSNSLESISSHIPIDIINIPYNKLQDHISVLSQKSPQFNNAKGVTTEDTRYHGKNYMIVSNQSKAPYNSEPAMQLVIHCQLLSSLQIQTDSKCINLEEHIAKLLEIKDKRNRTVYTQTKNGTFLYFNSPIQLTIADYDKVLQNRIPDTRSLFSLNITHDADIKYANLFLPNQSFDFAIIPAVHPYITSYEYESHITTLELITPQIPHAFTILHNDITLKHTSNETSEIPLSIYRKTKRW